MKFQAADFPFFNPVWGEDRYAVILREAILMQPGLDKKRSRDDGNRNSSHYCYFLSCRWFYRFYRGRGVTLNRNIYDPPMRSQISSVLDSAHSTPISFPLGIFRTSTKMDPSLTSTIFINIFGPSTRWILSSVASFVAKKREGATSFTTIVEFLIGKAKARGVYGLS